MTSRLRVAVFSGVVLIPPAGLFSYNAYHDYVKKAWLQRNFACSTEQCSLLFPHLRGARPMATMLRHKG